MRLKEMERLYYQKPWSDAELADWLGVDRTIIYRDRMELEASGVPFVEESRGRYRIDRQKYLSPVRLDIREKLSLYLAARKAAQLARVGQKPMASALSKLAAAMQNPMTEKLVRSAKQLMSGNYDSDRERVFETVANAWVDHLRLRVQYQGLTTRRPYWDRISPYLIEPSPWSDAVYVIGPSDVWKKIVAYRLDRILKASLSEPFDIPADFDEEALLRHAWGVWRGEGEPQEVVLRFAPGPAAKRLLESQWHPLEEVERLEDGGVIWRAPIAEWREMLPWIRGWGADVTVLAPDDLKQQLQSEAQRLAAIYLTNNAQPPSWFWLWAKADTESNQWHPLIYHLIDVGMTAKAMWEEVLSESERERFAGLVGLSVEQAGNLFAFLIAAHDLGKASPAFQDEVPFARPSWKSKDMISHRLTGFPSHHMALSQPGPCPISCRIGWRSPIGMPCKWLMQ
jgi:CRISPR-associated endonuclease/helicase Cas3